MSASNIALPQLHRRFVPLERYGEQLSQYQLLPFRFAMLDDQRMVMVNMAGEHMILPRSRLEEIVHRKLKPSEPVFEELVAKHFVMVPSGAASLDLLANAVRTRYSALANFTGLHLFVVTLRCDHSCPYCQVSRVSHDRVAYDMSKEVADAAVSLMFKSPNPNLKVEFQGGESLLNFERIRQIVERSEAINQTAGRNLQFVIATNLSQIDDAMLAYCKEHTIFISTSLDGPRWLHNANRPRPGGDSYERTIDGIARVRAALGHDGVAALMTTTAKSLECPEEIIDEYVARRFTSIFLRPLSPYGFAVKTGGVLGYPINEWNHFYERGLRHILKLNTQGTAIREEYASIVLRKMLTPFPSNYVDLQSPTGLGTSVIVYNYDGVVYASDEGRMLAEVGDYSLRLGTIPANNYAEIFGSERLIQIMDQTMTESTPMCHDCAFEPYCGTDPAFHQATQHDLVGHRPTSAFCKRNMFIFRLLLRILADEPASRDILMRWI